MLENVDWSFPVPIRFGPGRLDELGLLCRDAGLLKPLIVTDRGSSNLPFLDKALHSLSAAGISGAVYSEVSPNPTHHDVMMGRQCFRDGAHDGVIAIGGGSGMDGGKAISLVARNDHDVLEFDYDLGRCPALPTDALVPLITVPTTAGTGAETESTAMVTDTARGVKICVWHERHRPLTCILDPQLCVELPGTLTAWTGCDALVHAIEAFCVPQYHPMCDGIALEAIRLITPALPTAVRDGRNLDARGAMLAGSCLAGVSFLKGLGLVHAISHMVGAVFDTHHGLTNAVLLPPVLLYNRAAIADKTPQICRAMGLPDESFDALYSSVVALLDELDIPRDLATLGVTEASASELAVKAYGDAARATNPAHASVAEIEVLIRQAIVAARP